MNANLFGILMCASAVAFLMFSGKRTAAAVLGDLRDAELNNTSHVLDKELVAAGILSSEAQKRFHLKTRFLPFIFPLVLLAARMLIGYDSVEGTLLTGMFGFAIGVFVKSRALKKERERFKQKIEFYLPLAMERIVMAVEAGLDMVPALNALIELEQFVGDPNDPTTHLFNRVITLTESGLRFDKSLDEVSSVVEGTSLRHAFVHLGLAYRDGGEVISPLRELSDATQLQYQEHIEERIAKLPVKATMPLLVMFVGLLICFLTPPAVQIVSVTKDMSTSSNGQDRFSFGGSK